MAVTLTWVRDHYDTIVKDRYIDADERKNAVIDNLYGIITQEELLAVMDAYDNQTQLPAYDTGTETKTTSLSEGNHDIQISLTGYDTLVAVINVSSTAVSCVSVVGGACGGSGLPRLDVTGTWTVEAHLKEETSISDVCSWITSIGGWQSIQWTSHVLEAYYVYIGAAGHSVGFSPVTWDDVLGLYYYYINDPSSGNAKIGCGV